jgi:cyclophilin family peptidyl-prolyl cis-trans isomerase/HEAT repeat protein
MFYKDLKFNSLVEILPFKRADLSCVKWFVFLGFLSLLPRCVPPDYGKTKNGSVGLDFSDRQIQVIYELLERQSTDSLMAFLGHTNPSYRLASAQAMGSLKDERAIDTLVARLNDPFLDIRTASAFALGQMGKLSAEKPLIAAFNRYDSLNKTDFFNATVLEAVGKCGSRASLDLLCGIQTFRLSDTLLNEGRALGIYRLGLRDSFTPQSIRTMVRMVAEIRHAPKVRIVAANYLARLKTTYDTSVTNVIAPLVLREPNFDVRFNLARALGKVYNPKLVLPTLEQLYESESDYRVKLNILAAIQNFDYPKIQPLLLDALRERDVHVAMAAAEFFVKKGSPRDALFYKSASTDASLQPSVRQTMLAAAARWTQGRKRDSLNTALIDNYKSSQNPVEKCRLLRGISENGWNYEFIKTEAFATTNMAQVRTVAAECLVSICTAPDFFKTFRAASANVKRDFKATFFNLLKLGDGGISAVVSDALRNPATEFNKITMRDSIPLLYQAMQKMKMPNDLEAHESLRETINFISDSLVLPKKKDVRARGIDWAVFNSISENTTAVVKTTKGDIKMLLMKKNAPISVSNFTILARSGFFNGKAFHRVVPNFVVQTGCPRGDGYGSLDYTISSELSPLHYDQEGFVGMASAGNHTECSQWFITQTATFHLDPNYTIFAKVLEGMNVVRMLEQGDLVLNLTVN